MLLQFILSGAVVGFVVGATGVGGGSLMTPLLTLLLGVPPQVAVGTDLLFAAITKSAGVRSYARSGIVPWAIPLRMAAGSVPAALATLFAIHQWHPDAAAYSTQYAAVVQPALGIALLLTAGALAFRVQIQSLGLRAAAPPLAAATAGPGRAVLDTLPGADSGRALATVAIGALIGVLVTITSVGAGAIGTVALFFLYPAVPARQLIAADLAHAVPLTLIAGLGHAALGTVNGTMLLGLLLGSLPAIRFGAGVSSRLPEHALRWTLVAMLLLLGLRLLWI